MTNHRNRVLVACGIILSMACSSRTDHSRSEQPTPELRKGCTAEARILIGSKAEVVRFGHLSNGAPLECVAILRSALSSRMRGTPIARLVILRHGNSDWSLVFDADREMKNPNGYVGIDFIDDDWKFDGYDVSLTDQGSDGTSRFTLYFTFLGPDPGWPTEIGLNKATGRYQEFGPDNKAEHMLFKAELRNPPHRSRTR